MVVLFINCLKLIAEYDKMHLLNGLFQHPVLAFIYRNGIKSDFVSKVMKTIFVQTSLVN